MAGKRWNNEEEIKYLFKYISKEKKLSKVEKRKVNWEKIANKLNKKFNYNRTPKGCFWFYQRSNNKQKFKDKDSIPTRYPRPLVVLNGDKYERVVVSEPFYITAQDDEGNIIFALRVDNTQANVSRCLVETVNELNRIKENKT